MKIDWFTVIAQVLNFLILVWLLRRFLYKPILDAIEARENKVAGQLSDASSKMEEANKKLEEYQQKNEEFDEKKKEMMDQAVSQTEEEKQKLLEQARKDAVALGDQLKKATEEKEELLEKEIIEKTQQEVFDISRKTLKDLAGTELEDRVVQTFIGKLNDPSGAVKQQILPIFNSGKTEVMIKSAFDLSEKQKEEITSTIKNITEKDSAFTFETSPDLISGIELSVNGYKLAWNISSYLDSLEKNISKTIKEKSQDVIIN